MIYNQAKVDYNDSLILAGDLAVAVGSFGTELRNFLVFHSLDSSDSFFGGGVDIFKCCQKVTLLRTKSFMHLFQSFPCLRNCTLRPVLALKRL